MPLPPAPGAHPPQGAARRRGPLRPTAAIAADVLLPDDPALALALAQHLLVRPRMANHSFGLWGYSGEAKLGGGLTVQSGGIGAPSLASVVGDLAAHGAARIVRLGRCRALDENLRIGDALLVEAALPGDGTSRALAGASMLGPDQALAAALSACLPAAQPQTIASTDLLTWPAPERARAPRVTPPPSALDGESATLFALASELDLAAAALLVVEEAGDGALLDEAAYETSVLGLGAAAHGALAAVAQASPSAAASLL